ncbi:hypothetical protein FHS79_000494 [Polymorphobacter multimanifer]|uniref:Uncharacterized protein n=1 Tax=Polymorphobacter multimanifer TaxID=1070431 RepID=A0A841L1N8_9SPHN|nr:flagellar hook-length control protein FliK [Polymorphobacter multimanifer]MBB6226340.1 hypothetical protein [Polymorphobacter multimanifer]
MPEAEIVLPFASPKAPAKAPAPAPRTPLDDPAEPPAPTLAMPFVPLDQPIPQQQQPATIRQDKPAMPVVPQAVPAPRDQPLPATQSPLFASEIPSAQNPPQPRFEAPTILPPHPSEPEKKPPQAIAIATETIQPAQQVDTPTPLPPDPMPAPAPRAAPAEILPPPARPVIAEAPPSATVETERLGSIRLAVESGGEGTVSVRMQVQPSAAPPLEAGRTALAEALQAQGLRLDTLLVSLTPSQETAPNNGEDTGRPRLQDMSGQHGNTPDGRSRREPPPPAAAAWRSAVDDITLHDARRGPTPDRFA